MTRDPHPPRGASPQATPELGWCAWLLCDAASVPSADDWLTPAEHADQAALRIDRRRSDWRLGRWTAKRAVALIDGRGLPLERIAIIATESGAPLALIDGTPARYTISISHAAGRGLCVIAPPGSALGCDLERVEPRSDAFIADYFTASERAALDALQSEERATAATLLWSAKEAALKALRQGLRLDTRELEVTLQSDLAPTGWRRLIISDSPSGRSFDAWWRRENDLVVTVAAGGRLRPPRVLEPAP